MGRRTKKSAWTILTDGGIGLKKDSVIPDYGFLNRLEKLWFFDRNNDRSYFQRNGFFLPI